MSDIHIQARSLFKSYTRKDATPVEVISGVDLDIPAAKSISIVGVSGCGKSTLLHVLAGLDRPDSGSVKFQDKDIWSMNDRDLSAFRAANMGFIFQFHHLLPEFTAQENVMIPKLIVGSDVEEAKKDAQQLLSDLGLSDRLDHKPAELSGGEQQRVSFARALVNQPDVIFADEPTGNLDEKTTGLMLELIFEKSAEKKSTMVIVTHDISIANRCDIRYRLASGKLEQIA